MRRRSVYLVVFAIAALGAGVLVYLSQPRTEIVRSRVDLAVLAPITAEDLEVVRVAPADAPSNAARLLEEVVGRYPALPILAGQDIDLRVLEVTPGSRAFGFGAPLGPGQVAFALPVEPAAAVGGALVPGARVDVVAVPAGLRTSADAEVIGTLLGQGLTVLALRTAEGTILRDPEAEVASGRVVVPPKLGAVVVAIPAARVTEFATASVTSVFVLALSPTGQAPQGAETP